MYTISRPELIFMGLVYSGAKSQKQKPPKAYETPWMPRIGNFRGPLFMIPSSRFRLGKINSRDFANCYDLITLKSIEVKTRLLGRKNGCKIPTIGGGTGGYWL